MSAMTVPIIVKSQFETLEPKDICHHIVVYQPVTFGGGLIAVIFNYFKQITNSEFVYYSIFEKPNINKDVISLTLDAMDKMQQLTKIAAAMKDF